MTIVKKYLFLGVLIFANASATWALAPETQQNQDVFVPLAKYIANGDAEALSAWFATSLEIDILGRTNISSKQQAKQILKDFFSENTPKSFSFSYSSGKVPMKYAVGTLNASSNKFRVTIFVRTTSEGNYIENIRIEKE